MAGGSITLSGSSSDNVLQFSFSNASWNTIGDGADLPGPVTAITVNDRNYSSVFAAGRCVFVLSYPQAGNLYRYIVLSMDHTLSWLPGMAIPGHHKALPSGAPALFPSSLWFLCKINTAHKD